MDFKKKLLNLYKWFVKVRVGIVLGAIAGYFYYSFYGCTEGACHVTSSPVLSPIYGMMVGALVADKLISDMNNVD